MGPGRYWSEVLQDEVELEEDIVKPLVSGEEAVPFATPPTETFLIFPYYVSKKEYRLLTESEMKKLKRCWVYLKKNEKSLRNREHGKMDHDEWYGYVYPKNIDKQERPKLLVPRLLLNLFASGDPKGEVFLDNVDVGGVILNKSWDLFHALAILNSAACNFAWRQTSKPFRGEYRSANKQFIAPLPIPKTKDQKPLAALAKTLADLHAKRLRAVATVHRRFQTDLPPAKLISESPLPPSLSRRLANFDETPRAELFKEMEKLAGAKLGPSKRETWDKYLIKQVNEVGVVKRAIADAMADLNDRVYKLYGLNESDIKSIEERGGSQSSLGVS